MRAQPMSDPVHFDPIDDEDNHRVYTRNAGMAKRLENQRLAKRQADIAKAELAGKVRQYMAGVFDAPAVKVSIHPKGTFHVPGIGKRKPEIDVTPSPSDFRVWQGFPMACDASMEGLRQASDRMTSKLGPWSEILAGCSTDTARRWRYASARLKSASALEFDQWCAVMARGMTAIGSEFEYRKSVSAQNAR